MWPLYVRVPTLQSALLCLTRPCGGGGCRGTQRPHKAPLPPKGPPGPPAGAPQGPSGPPWAPKHPPRTPCHDPPLILPWSSHDPFMILDGPSVIRPWSSHDPPMILPWSGLCTPKSPQCTAVHCAHLLLPWQENCVYYFKQTRFCLANKAQKRSPETPWSYASTDRFWDMLDIKKRVCLKK